MSEFENKMYSVEIEYGEIMMASKMLGSAISQNDPFRAMQALAEINKAVKKAMHETIDAQEEYLKPIREDAMRIA
jgi:hypothetical protein